MNKPRELTAVAAPRPEAHLWQAGWVLGVAACAAAMLAVFGRVSFTTGAALAVASAPGVLGYLWRPTDLRRYGLLGAWTLATLAAALLSGGATGPLVAWCVAPVLVGMLIQSLPAGAAMAGLSVLAAAIAEWAGFVRAPPEGAEGVVLTAVGLLLLFLGAAGAAGLVLRAVADDREGLEAEKRWFEGALAELPYLGAALDREGRPEAVFGTLPPGLDADRLAEGLAEAAEPEDAPTIAAAICEALDHGVGAAEFSPRGSPGRRLRLALRRRGEAGLSAMLHEAAPRPAAGPIPAEAPSPTEDPRVEELEAALAQAEAARAESERARAAAEAGAAAKSRFLANMSHELRTPLNAIMGFSDMMRARMFGEMAPKYGEYAELIHESGRHLMDLINDVLDMSKIEAERYAIHQEAFDARDAIGAALRLVRLQADEAGVQLRGLLPSEPLPVMADRRAVKQIVLNLVSNALKFTPRQGSVTVSARARDQDLELVVADSGVGIAPEDLERLGQPFEQAGDAEKRLQGTGLGLSLVKAFAGLHGGAMEIESALGEGTAVTVRMPVMRTDEAGEERPEEPVPAEAAPVVAVPDAPEDPPEPEEVPDPPPKMMGATVIQLPLSR